MSDLTNRLWQLQTDILYLLPIVKEMEKQFNELKVVERELAHENFDLREKLGMIKPNVPWEKP